MASVATLSGSGALAGGGASNFGTVTLSGSGAIAGIATGGTGLAVVALAGSGALAGVGAASTHAIATLAGSGVLTGVSKGAPGGVATLTGSGVLTAVGVASTASVATMAGVGALNGVLFSLMVVGKFAGQGSLHAIGSWTNTLPFDFDLAWTIPILGNIVSYCSYDPSTQNLRIYFTGTGGQFVTVQHQNVGVTNAIQLSPNQQAYALSLIR